AFERCAATARRVNHNVIHKLPGIRQVKSPSSRMGFLRFHALIYYQTLFLLMVTFLNALTSA
ncbi:MAG: hypothetical protein E6325_19490, partial [Enterobacteriaceae bacterium]|nr:hypothetical protein [Enterobacteriaceae bacterium]